jgi:hypothetical protein
LPRSTNMRAVGSAVDESDTNSAICIPVSINGTNQYRYDRYDMLR